MRRRRRAEGLLAALLVLLGIAVGLPLNVVGTYFPPWVTSLRALWVGLLIGVALLIVLLSWLLPRLQTRQLRGRLAGVPARAPGWIDRAELAELVSALTDRATGLVALTTSMVGAGGFGKTALAVEACHHRTVRKRFSDQIVWVTVGRDREGAALAGLINDVIAELGGEASQFSDPEPAGGRLAEMLSGGGPSLVVADDVWTAGQLAPFLRAAGSSRILVTTRMPHLLEPGTARQIRIDQMTTGVSTALLTRGLPEIPSDKVRELLAVTHGWPLLLNLLNWRLRDDIGRGASIETASGDAVRRMSEGGPAALDIADTGRRETAAAATIEYSLEVLQSNTRERFVELGIFPADTQVPVEVVALLWSATAAICRADAESICDRLAGLSLVSISFVGVSRCIAMHDVLRAYARRDLKPERRLAAHAMLVAAARPPADQDHGDSVTWWRLPRSSDYFWRHLTYHLSGAGLADELDRVCCDLRWAATKLEYLGPAAVESDLMLSPSPRAQRLRQVVGRNAHLLTSSDDSEAVITTFIG